MSLKDKITKVIFPKEFMGMKRDLKEMHNIEKIEFGEKLIIEK